MSPTAGNGAAPESYRCSQGGRKITVVVRDGAVEAEWLDRLGRVVGRRSFSLTDLAPSADHTWHPHENRHKLVGALVAVAIPTAAFALWHLATSEMAWLWFAVGTVVGIACVIAYAMLDPSRLEYAWFRYRSGIVAFTISRDGGDKRGFDTFIEHLERDIRAGAERQAIQ